MRKIYYKVIFYIQSLLTIYLFTNGILGILSSGKFFSEILAARVLICLPPIVLNFYGLKASRKFLMNNMNLDSITKSEKILISISRIVSFFLILGLIFVSD